MDENKQMFNKKREIGSSNNNDNRNDTSTSRMVIVSEDVLILLEKQMSELRSLVSMLNRPEEVIFDNEEAAKFLKVSTRTLQKYREQHLLTFSQHDRMIWYRKSDLIDFLQRHQIRSH